MVKVLVATTEAQGNRGDDYAWAIDGELAYVPVLSCDGDTCGCRRGFVGMASGQAITTALVVDRPDISRTQLATALADSLERQREQRNQRLGIDVNDKAAAKEDFREIFQALLATTDHFAAGSVLERDGQMLRRRAKTEPFPAPFGITPS